jgi:hypothetical protein
MIRSIFVSGVLLIVVSAAYAQTTKSDREAARLIGAVKSVRSVSTDYAGDKIVGDGFMQRGGDYVFYDQSGRETDRKPVSDFGEPMGSMPRKYDLSGQMIESSWIDPKGSLLRKDVFEYVDGRVATHLSYDHSGKLIEKTSKTYGANGLLEYETYFDPITPVAKTIYKYDSSQRLIEVAFFLANGAKAVAPVGPCLGAHRVVNEYDQNGRIAEETFLETDGSKKKTYRWSYDGKGNFATYEIESNSSTARFVYRYEFDSIGNWTKQITTGTSLQKGLTVFGKPDTPYVRSTVTKREITYY